MKYVFANGQIRVFDYTVGLGDAGKTAKRKQDEHHKRITPLGTAYSACNFQKTV